jgi:hypothetical protein
MFDSSQSVNHEKTQDNSSVQSTTTRSPNASMRTQDEDAVIWPNIRIQDPTLPSTQTRHVPRVYLPAKDRLPVSKSVYDRLAF